MNRGCCWYFPTYELVDIKNILDSGQEAFVRWLMTQPQVHISRYQLQVGGRFEQEQYAKHLRTRLEAPTSGFDESLHFRLCSLFGVNGCTISADLRPHPCNLYLCREVIEWAGPSYRAYQQERKDYFAYCSYVNEILRDELLEKEVDLLTRADVALSVVAACSIPEFQSSQLPMIRLTTPTNPLSA